CRYGHIFIKKLLLIQRPELTPKPALQNRSIFPIAEKPISTVAGIIMMWKRTAPVMRYILPTAPDDGLTTATITTMMNRSRFQEFRMKFRHRNGVGKPH